MRRSTKVFLVLTVAVALTSCGKRTRDDGPGSARIPSSLPGDAVPKPEPRSRYGNGPTYKVFNKWYTVMESSAGYRERGVASWYGKKFHGNLTSNREVYDMYAMTAAHKTLPLPTYVHVRNLRNDKSIIVRVNDRGPFVHNRIIDLSYAAALKLDMVRDGTSMVEVTAYNFDEPSTIAPPPVAAPQPRKRTEPSSLQSIPSVSSPDSTVPPDTEETATEHRIFVQVGAFGDRANADRRMNMLQRSGISDVNVLEDLAASPPLYRVRIGPVTDVEQYDRLVVELENLGVTDPYLISE
jgi:peptidoglycan lytic transglycosylase